jgi:hypothetical protein
MDTLESDYKQLRELLKRLSDEFDAMAKLASIKPVEAHESAFRKLVAEIDENLEATHDM